MNEIFFNEDGDRLIVKVTGRLDMDSSEPAAAQINPRLPGKKEVIFDLSELVYLSSYGLRMLLSTARELNKSYAMLKLAAVPAPILQVLKTSGLARFFAIHDTVEAAIDSSSRPESGDLDKVLK